MKAGLEDLIKLSFNCPFFSFHRKWWSKTSDLEGISFCLLSVSRVDRSDRLQTGITMPSLLSTLRLTSYERQKAWATVHFLSSFILVAQEIPVIIYFSSHFPLTFALILLFLSFFFKKKKNEESEWRKNEEVKIIMMTSPLTISLFIVS